jgi:hypothetical protein
MPTPPLFLWLLPRRFRAPGAEGTARRSGWLRRGATAVALLLFLHLVGMTFVRPYAQACSRWGLRTWLALATQAEPLLITFDGLAPGVLVPESLRQQEVTLSFSHGFRGDDLSLDDDSIQQTLSFQGQPQRTRVPLSAIRRIRGLRSKLDLVF